MKISLLRHAVPLDQTCQRVLGHNSWSQELLYTFACRTKLRFVKYIARTHRELGVECHNPVLHPQHPLSWPTAKARLSCVSPAAEPRGASSRLLQRQTKQTRWRQRERKSWAVQRLLKHNIQRIRVTVHSVRHKNVTIFQHCFANITI